MRIRDVAGNRISALLSLTGPFPVERRANRASPSAVESHSDDRLAFRVVIPSASAYPSGCNSTVVQYARKVVGQQFVGASSVGGAVCPRKLKKMRSCCG